MCAKTLGLSIVVKITSILIYLWKTTSSILFLQRLLLVYFFIQKLHFVGNRKKISQRRRIVTSPWKIYYLSLYLLNSPIILSACSIRKREVCVQRQR